MAVNLWVLAIMAGIVGIIIAAKGRIHVPEPLARVHATNGVLPYVMPVESESMCDELGGRGSDGIMQGLGGRGAAVQLVDCCGWAGGCNHCCDLRPFAVPFQLGQVAGPGPAQPGRTPKLGTLTPSPLAGTPAATTCS